MSDTQADPSRSDQQPASPDQRIDAFLAATRRLDGQVGRERTIWNRVATPDAICRFASCIGDDNPLWLDPGHARSAGFATVLAPPTFLTSVLYPILHGAPLLAPLSNLIGEVDYSWRRPIPVDAPLSAEARHAGVREARDLRGRRMICVFSSTTYREEEGATIGHARCLMARLARSRSALLVDRPLARHPAGELEKIRSNLLSARRRGSDPFSAAELRAGSDLPERVVGPLTMGDLICWHAAIGPPFQAGVLGLRDCLEAPHSAIHHPVFGWPVKDSQQHEDTHLTRQRGLPAPFDNGVMRLALLGRLITDWMGDRGVLRRLRVRLVAPVLLGDVTWYQARIQSSSESEEGRDLTLFLTGRNQLGETTTRGLARLVVPADLIAS